MILSAQEIRELNLISPFREENLQPNGYDVTVTGIETYRSGGGLYLTDKLLPETAQLPLFGETDIWTLRQGTYLVRLGEEVKLPPDVMAYLHPRSSLLRMGADLGTAVWDAGYHGAGMCQLQIFNPKGIEIEQGARIGQLTFHRLSTQTETPYAGSYQGERLS